MGVFLHLPIYLSLLLLLFLCYEASIPVVLYCWTASCTIYQLVSLLDSILALLWPKELAHFGLTLRPNWNALLAHTACFALIYGLTLLFLIRRLFRLGPWRMATLPVVIISLVMVLVNHTMGMIFKLYAAPNASPLLHLMEYVWNLLCCLFCLCIQFHMFQINHREEELAVARQLILEQEKQYQISKSTMDAVNRKRKGTHALELGRLTYVEVEGHYLSYHTQEQIYQVRGSLKKAAESLTPPTFFLCNQCYLVNLSYVEQIKGNLVTVAGEEILISRPRKKPFLEALAAYSGRG